MTSDDIGELSRELRDQSTSTHMLIMEAKGDISDLREQCERDNKWIQGQLDIAQQRLDEIHKIVGSVLLIAGAAAIIYAVRLVRNWLNF